MNRSVEDVFQDFVLGFGGELVRDLLPPGNPPINADFLFRKHGVIAELKCLENSSFGPNYPKKMQELADDWMRRRLMIFFGTVNIELQKLRPECQREWLDLIAGPLQRNVVKKADTQIRETKKWLGMLDAKGLLLVASDGNVVMQPYDVAYFITRILGKKTTDGRAQYSNIDGFFQFSLNHPVKMHGFDHPILFSHAGPRSTDDDKMRAFCEELQAGWFKFLCKIKGQPIKTISSDGDAISKIKWM